MVNSLPDVSARFGVWASAAPAPLRRRSLRCRAGRADCGTRAFCVRAGRGTLRCRTGRGTFAFRVRACGRANVHARVRARSCADVHARAHARSCASGCAATHDRADARSRFRFLLHNRFRHCLHVPFATRKPILPIVTTGCITAPTQKRK